MRPEKSFSLLNIKYIIVPECDKTFADNKNYRLLLHDRKDKIKLFENKTCFRRAFLVKQALYFNTQAEVFKNIRRKDFDFTTTVALESPIPYQARKNDSRFSEKGFCDIIEYKPNYVRITASAENDCFLVISDTYYPGWKAYIDGKEEPILKANYVLRALFMKAGTHTVEFKYTPASFKLGAMMSLLTLLFLIGYFVYRSVRKDGK